MHGMGGIYHERSESTDHPLAWNVETEPFPGLLTDRIESRGWRVDDNEPAKYLRTAYDAVIIH
jgi:hypothetical protein